MKLHPSEPFEIADKRGVHTAPPGHLVLPDTVVVVLGEGPSLKLCGLPA